MGRSHQSCDSSRHTTTPGRRHAGHVTATRVQTPSQSGPRARSEFRGRQASSDAICLGNELGAFYFENPHRRLNACREPTQAAGHL